MPGANLILRSTRSRKSSCLVSSKDCLSNSAAAADWFAEQRFRFYRCSCERRREAKRNKYPWGAAAQEGSQFRHTARHGICSVTAWYMVSQPKSHSVGGFLNRRFEWRFWERSERRRWRMQRGERVAAVKISSARRKAAQRFWAPQQRLAAMGKSRSRSEPRNLSACGHSREPAPIPHPTRSAHPPPRGTSRSAARR